MFLLQNITAFKELQQAKRGTMKNVLNKRKKGSKVTKKEEEKKKKKEQLPRKKTKTNMEKEKSVNTAL